MIINKQTALLKLEHEKYIVMPFKYGDKKSYPYRIENPKEADLWIIMGYSKDKCITLAEFNLDDQDKAHQFAELLTECLTKIKAFTDETTETK